MLRRQKTTEIDGRPIVNLPPKHITVDNVEFSDDEMAIYKALETKSQLKLNKYLDKNSVSGKSTLSVVRHHTTSPSAAGCTAPSFNLLKITTSFTDLHQPITQAFWSLCSVCVRRVVIHNSSKTSVSLPQRALQKMIFSSAHVIFRMRWCNA